MRRVSVWDTTLRDGLQVPGVAVTLEDKIEMAKNIRTLGVSYMEIGYPAVSEKAFQETYAIAEAVGQDADAPWMCAYAQADRKELDIAYKSLEKARYPMLHLVVGASRQQMEGRLHKTRQEVLEMAAELLSYAKSLTPKVQFTIEDASRADEEFLLQMVKTAAAGGASVINISDTVGTALPEEFGRLTSEIRSVVDEINPAILLSVHCHNDLGMAVANTLSAVRNGADKVECTINAIGERAGLAALEEVAVALRYHRDIFEADTDIVTERLSQVSRFVSYVTGLTVQVNKPIVGQNAFLHSAGMHQNAEQVYAALSPEDVGAHLQDLELNAESGTPEHLRDALRSIGYESTSEEEFAQIYEKFRLLVQKKKQVFLHDLYFLLQKGHYVEKEKSVVYLLKNFRVTSSDEFPDATVKLVRGAEVIEEHSYGDGPIDALYTAIKNAVQMDFRLLEYRITSVTSGKEALGRVIVRLEHKGEIYYAHSTDTDTIKASAIALLNGINNMILTGIRKNEMK